jgi:hypothetical protein
MNKTVKDKIIERLNKGFDFSIPIDAKWTTHQRAFRSDGAQSWYFTKNISRKPTYFSRGMN